MATKKTNSKAPVKQQKRSTPSISARIDRLVDYENSKVKAIASVNIGGAFAIRTARPSIRIFSILSLQQLAVS